MSRKKVTHPPARARRRAARYAIGFVGGGNMATAMIKGFVAGGVCAPAQIVASRVAAKLAPSPALYPTTPVSSPGSGIDVEKVPA